jgi:hypothetical protein
MNSDEEVYEIEFTEDCRDENKKIIYISHMYYGRRKYIN